MIFRRAKRKPVKGKLVSGVYVEEQKRDPGPPTDIYDDAGRVKHPCPWCGGRVVDTGSCHTYGGNEDGTGWMMCFPACWSAVEFYCVDNDTCEWSYTWGLNPRNPRAHSNSMHRPDWIPVGARWDDGWPA